MYPLSIHCIWIWLIYPSDLRKYVLPRERKCIYKSACLTFVRLGCSCRLSYPVSEFQQPVEAAREHVAHDFRFRRDIVPRPLLTQWRAWRTSTTERTLRIYLCVYVIMKNMLPYNLCVCRPIVIYRVYNYARMQAFANICAYDL